jgi:hypothetical protein
MELTVNGKTLSVDVSEEVTEKPIGALPLQKPLKA